LLRFRAVGMARYRQLRRCKYIFVLYYVTSVIAGVRCAAYALTQPSDDCFPVRLLIRHTNSNGTNGQSRAVNWRRSLCHLQHMRHLRHFFRGRSYVASRTYIHMTATQNTSLVLQEWICQGAWDWRFNPQEMVGPNEDQKTCEP